MKAWSRGPRLDSTRDSQRGSRAMAGASATCLQSAGKSKRVLEVREASSAACAGRLESVRESISLACPFLVLSLSCGSVASL